MIIFTYSFLRLMCLKLCLVLFPVAIPACFHLVILYLSISLLLCMHVNLPSLGRTLYIAALSHITTDFSCLSFNELMFYMFACFVCVGIYNLSFILLANNATYCFCILPQCFFAIYRFFLCFPANLA